MPRVLDLSAKLFRDLDLDEVIYLHVAGRLLEWTSDFHVISSLEQIETSMRSANARENSKFYGPALCAFAMLDQLGTCYDRTSTGAPDSNTNIKRALHHFCNIKAQSPEARHLYAFRNGQAHDASYVNKDIKGRWYLFRNDEQISSVIKLPKVAWDGEASTIGPDTTTLVSRDKLVNLASDAVKEVRDIYWTKRMDLDVRVSKTTLIHKYLLWLQRTT